MNAMTARVIGVDCATKDARIGIALGELSEDGLAVKEVRLCAREERAADLLAVWLRREPPCRTLLAIDAPLGWPAQLSSALQGHRAGEALDVSADHLFRRETDLFVYKKLKKTPLDVGADRIARTAHSALRLLADLGTQLGAVVPLAWRSDWEGVAAIEVYPAATLLAHKLKASGYKKPEQTTERERLAEALRAHLGLPKPCQAVVDSADALDAVVCVLAGADFVRGHAHPPIDRALAEREGWIWFYADVPSAPETALQ